MTRAFVRSLVRWHAAQIAAIPAALLPCVDWERAAFERSSAEAWARHLRVMVDSLAQNLEAYNARGDNVDEGAKSNGESALRALQQAAEAAEEHANSFDATPRAGSDRRPG